MIEKIIDNNTELADDTVSALDSWFRLKDLADRLESEYREGIDSKEERERNIAIDTYWEALNTIDNGSYDDGNGVLEGYISSVHIKSYNNLRNKIENGAKLLLPNERNTYEENSPSGLTPDVNVARNSETPTDASENNSGKRFSLKEESGAKPDATVSEAYENAVKDTRGKTLVGALATSLWTADGRRRFRNKFAESYFDYTRSVKALAG